MAQKLKDIANEFIKYIEIPLNIVDIEIVGSNASYNYNENSDLDLHIIVNSEVNYVEPTILRQLYNSKKNSFNDNYDLSINGTPIELYIEDVKDGNATNGRYSLSKNEWVVFPKPITYEIPDISEKLSEYETKCNDILANGSAQDILDLVNDIYMMRKLGLAESGEASIGNLVFKELRNEDMIPKLKEKYYSLRSTELSESRNIVNEDKDNKNDISTKIDDLVDMYNYQGLDKWNLMMLLGYIQQAIHQNTYNGKIDNLTTIYKQLDGEYFDMLSDDYINNKAGKTVNEISEKIDNLLRRFNAYGLNKSQYEQLSELTDKALEDNSYNGKYDNLKKEMDEIHKFYFYEPEELGESKKEEASLSRLLQHTKNKNSFAVIGSQDKDTKKSRFSELKSLVSRLRNKISNLGFNYLEGTYTYEDGEQGIEDSLIVYNIPKDDALDIAKQINQESIIWKDDNYFGFLDTNGNEEGTFSKNSLTFDNQITSMYGSRLKSGNGYKPAFAFECKLIETDTKGSTFSKQLQSHIVKYPVCSIKLEADNTNNENTLFWGLVNKLKGGNEDSIDSVDVTDYIVTNDILAYKSEINKSLEAQGVEKAYDILINGDYAGYIGYKDDNWFGMQRTK